MAFDLDYERTLFERVCIAHDWVVSRLRSGEYASTVTAAAWLAWQLRAGCIEGVEFS